MSPQTYNWISHFTYSLLLHYLEKCNHIHFFTKNSPDFNPVDYEIWAVMQRRVYTTDKSIVWMNWNGGSSTSGAVLNSQFLTRLLTSGEEDIKCASMLKEGTSSTACELTMLIFSMSVTFNATCLTVTSLIMKSCNVDQYILVYFTR